MKPALICVGHAALDRVFTVDSWPTGSAKIVASTMEEHGGGMAANAAVAAARLGGDVSFWGPTGDDASADAIEAQLAAEQVDVHWLKRIAGLRSSSSAVLVDARGERLVVGFRSEALRSGAHWLPLDSIRSARAVLADVRWPDGAAAALQAAREYGIPSVLDGEVAQPDVLDRLVCVADHVLFSERGLSVLTRDCEGGLRAVLEHGARVAAVTQGERGVQWLECGSNALHTLPAFAVHTVDTLAAGDVFHGAYALAIAEGRPIAEAMRFASAAAAIKCSRRGGRSGAPTRAEVEAFLAAKG
jgi:sulfofructose kinase